MLIECLAHEKFDNRLSADVQFTGCNVEFMEHILGKIHIHSLYRRHHSTGVSKVAGNVPAALCPFSDRLRGYGLPGFREDR